MAMAAGADAVVAFKAQFAQQKSNASAAAPNRDPAKQNWGASRSKGGRVGNGTSLSEQIKNRKRNDERKYCVHKECTYITLVEQVLRLD